MTTSRQSRLLILEGPDMTGKTNIAQEFCRRTDWSYFKNKNERKNFVDDPDYFKNCLKYGVPYQLSMLEQAPCDVVFDRHYPTEWVYSRAFNRETCRDTLDDVDRRFAQLNAAIVICHRSDYSGISDDTFPDRLSSEKLKEIDELYSMFGGWSRCDCLWLNVDSHDLHDQVGKIMVFTADVWNL